MSAHLSPYLHFRGQARDALTFYAAVFGAEPTISTFAEYGGMGVPEADQAQVMHGQVDGPGGLLLMCSDVPSHMEAGDLSGFTVTLSGDDDATLRGWWAGLSEGATIDQPLEVAPWGDAFGMLTDRFGTPWMVNIAGTGAAADAP